jgi:hypothetical protein
MEERGREHTAGKGNGVGGNRLQGREMAWAAGEERVMGVTELRGRCRGMVTGHGNGWGRGETVASGLGAWE